MSGLRIFSSPCQDMIAKASPDMAAGKRAVLGDFIANVVVSALSTPLHQLYGFIVTSGAVEGAAKEPFVSSAVGFLKRQYLTPAGRLSSVAARDVVLRIAYNAGIFTLYGSIDRAFVEHWPKTWTW